MQCGDSNLKAEKKAAFVQTLAPEGEAAPALPKYDAS